MVWTLQSSGLPTLLCNQLYNSTNLLHKYLVPPCRTDSCLCFTCWLFHTRDTSISMRTAPNVDSMRNCSYGARATQPQTVPHPALDSRLPFAYTEYLCLFIFSSSNWSVCLCVPHTRGHGVGRLPPTHSESCLIFFVAYKV